MMNESNHDLIADDDFMTPTKNVGLRISDDAMCELAKPNYVTNQFATHIEVESSFEREMQKRRRLSFEAPSFSLGFTQSMTPEKNDPSKDDNVDNVVWDTSGTKSVSGAYKGSTDVVWDKNP
uniref:Uncharacterized protein n=1 Tax=Tanacetum cinerariifolium TaxID=118510 RepID=A0A699I450_TANCI|nr:hypothetical protein [Tanacetum cinerariifolium]